MKEAKSGTGFSVHGLHVFAICAAVVAIGIQVDGGTLADKIREESKNRRITNTSTDSDSQTAIDDTAAKNNDAAAMSNNSSSSSGSSSSLLVDKRKITSGTDTADSTSGTSDNTSSSGSTSGSSATDTADTTSNTSTSSGTQTQFGANDQGVEYPISVGDLSSRQVLNMSVSDLMAYIKSSSDTQSSGGDSTTSSGSSDSQFDALYSMVTTHQQNSMNEFNANLQSKIDSILDGSKTVADYQLSYSFSNLIYNRLAAHYESVGSESVSSESVSAASSQSGVSTCISSESGSSGAKTIKGSVVDESGEVMGSAVVQTSKVKTTKSGDATVDVTISVTDLTGKTTTAKAKGVSASGDNSVALTVPGWGTVDLVVGADGDSSVFLGTVGDNSIVSSDATDDFTTGEAKFSVDCSSGFSGLQNVISMLLPLDETFDCGEKGKWKFAKATTCKVVKNSDGEYELSIDQTKNKTNLSGLTLSYVPKTGKFKGSFKVYLFDTSAAKPKLKTKKATVTGVITGGIGIGTAKISGTDIAWPVMITR